MSLHIPLASVTDFRNVIWVNRERRGSALKIWFCFYSRCHGEQQIGTSEFSTDSLWCDPLEGLSSCSIFQLQVIGVLPAALVHDHCTRPDSLTALPEEIWNSSSKAKYLNFYGFKWEENCRTVAFMRHPVSASAVSGISVCKVLRAVWILMLLQTCLQQFLSETAVNTCKIFIVLLWYLLSSSPLNCGLSVMYRTWKTWYLFLEVPLCSRLLKPCNNFTSFNGLSWQPLAYILLGTT